VQIKGISRRLFTVSHSLSAIERTERASSDFFLKKRESQESGSGGSGGSGEFPSAKVCAAGTRVYLSPK